MDPNANASSPLEIGTKLGPFRLVTQLGEGGFAPVYLAVEEHAGIEIRVVALKIFFTKQLGAAAYEQVVSEARALSRVEHPNIVRFFQILEDRTAGIVGLAMEHVRGQSLANRLDTTGVLSIADTLGLGMAIASALTSVHAAGLIHRDVKPGNVIETEAGHKLIDFGIATMRRRPDGAGAAATQSASSPKVSVVPPSVVIPASGFASGASAGGGASSEGADLSFAEDRTVSVAPRVVTVRVPSSSAVSNEKSERDNALWVNATPYLPDTVTVEDDSGQEIAGTMGYIDPACLGKGAQPDASSDLYALGATLYECLAGRLPASPEPESTIIRSAIAFGVTRAPPLREVAPHVPEDVARLIDSLVDPDRALRPRRAEAVFAELDRLRRGALGRRRRLPEDGPFRGLEAFDEAHRDVFFGRAAEIALALDALRSRGLLALVGASGSGKSSLARAGVLPAIVDGGLGVWPKTFDQVIIQPGPDPRAAVERAFAPLLGAFPRTNATSAVTPSTFVTSLAAHVDGTEKGIVILVDGLEEIITAASSSRAGAAPVDDVGTSVAWFVEVLASISSTPVPGVRVIVTARRDFLDGLLALPSLGSAIARSVQLITPLTGRAFADALEERLAAYGYTLEDAAMRDELARALVDAPEAMPLFEFALQRLWEEGDHVHRRLGRAALERIGGIGGALEKHAEATLQAVIAHHGPAAGSTARDLLIALTSPSGTRTRRTVDEIATELSLSPSSRALLDAIIVTFEKGRLIVFEDGRLTLAHETLLRSWPRLAQWIAAVRHRRELVLEIEQAAKRWRDRREDRALHLRGRLLRDARDVARSEGLDGKSGSSSLSQSALAFIASSRRAETRGLMGVGALVSSVLIGLGVLFGLYRLLQHDAQKRERAAEEFAATLHESQQTPETERARAIQKLLNEKTACEKELARCTPSSSSSSALNSSPPTDGEARDAGSSE